MQEYHVDPNTPAARQFVQVLDDMRRRAVMRRTVEELDALNRQAAANRQMRQAMFGKPRPVFRDTAAD